MITLAILCAALAASIALNIVQAIRSIRRSPAKAAHDWTKEETDRITKSAQKAAR